VVAPLAAAAGTAALAATLVTTTTTTVVDQPPTMVDGVPRIPRTLCIRPLSGGRLLINIHTPAWVPRPPGAVDPGAAGSAVPSYGVSFRSC
jgi:hypothetical protein